LLLFFAGPWQEIERIINAIANTLVNIFIIIYYKKIKKKAFPIEGRLLNKLDFF